MQKETITGERLFAYAYGILAQPDYVRRFWDELELPSLFDESMRHLREKVRLLSEFASVIAEPIQKDDKEHIEYVPTQIVTEYFRHVFTVEGTAPIDGIMYRSSRRSGGVCYVVFVDNEHCADAEIGSEHGELHLLLPPDAVQVFGPPLSPWAAG